jgi:uncharacterized damage-inducible protein DinB
MIEIVKHIEYQRWANGKIGEQIKTLPTDVIVKDFGGSFPSIRLTLLHMLQADYRWLQRLNGIPIVDIPSDWQHADMNSMLSTWTNVQGQLVSRVKELVPGGNQNIKFITAKGDSHELPLADVIAHLVNHATYHRGQLVNMMRMAGAKPESTDYFLFAVAQQK